MKPNTDVTQSPPVNTGTAASHGEDGPGSRSNEVRSWDRILAWLGLGCIGAANPAPGSKHCAPGCVRKPVDRTRRKRLAVAQRSRLRPPPATSAAGALARKSRQVLERVLFWVSP
jgi:hypothetical protein